MCRRHEFFPRLGRQTAARDLLHRRTIVITKPDTGGQSAGVTDEQCVTEGLRRAGLTGGLPTFQPSGFPCTFIDNADQHAVHGCSNGFAQYAWWIVVFVLVKHLAVRIGNAFDDMRRGFEAAIHHRGIGGSQFQQRNFRRAERNRSIGLQVRFDPHTVCDLRHPLRANFHHQLRCDGVQRIGDSRC